MNYDKTKHHRHSIRLKEYDYSCSGIYFITLVVQHRQCVFGVIKNGEMSLNMYGQIIQEEWNKTIEIRPNIQLDVYVTMPNHFHGILIINNPVGAADPVAPIQGNITSMKSDRTIRQITPIPEPIPENKLVGATRWVAPIPEEDTKTIFERATVPIKPTKITLQSNSLGSIIGQFKSITSKRIRQAGLPNFSWQRNYYEHIIRDDRDFQNIAEYIINNPLLWEKDREYNR